MERIKRIFVAETDSTNRWLGNYRGEEGSVMTVVCADYQTAGRGQGTNQWESERGKNLLASMLIHPKGVPVARQFVLLEAAALAIMKALAHYADGFCIKWPNDIYYHDRKISGTLSECAVGSEGIKRCIIGTGINVNQTEFVSDAPNPVSLRQIFGKETSVSFQTLYRLLYMYQDIDANWLVMGEGSMYKADHIAPRIYNQHNEVHSNTAGGDINVGPDTIVTKKTVDSLESTIAAQKKRIHELEAINTTLQNVINSTFAPRI